MKRRCWTIVLSALFIQMAGATNPMLPYAQSAQDSIMVMVERENNYRYGYQSCCTLDEKKLYLLTIDSMYTFQNNHTELKLIYNRIEVQPSAVGLSNKGYSGVQNYMVLLSRMIRDIPEFYIMESYIPRYTADYATYYVRIYSSYNPSLYAREMAAIDSVVSGVVEKTETMTSDYEKVCFLHDTLCKITRYGGISDAYAGSIKGVFLNHRAVCEGWSRAFLYLCQRTGIRCLYIDGAIDTTPDAQQPTWGSHAWNHVEVDGKWYLVDATSDGALGTVGRRAFLRGQSYFDQNYTYLFNGDGENANLYAYTQLPSLAASDYNPTGTGCMNTSFISSTSKIMHNGRLLIRREHKWYDVLGAEIMKQ